MQLEKILNMTRNPFDEAVIRELNKQTNSLNENQVVLLALYYKYYDKFSEEMDVDLYMPKSLIYMGKIQTKKVFEMQEQAGKTLFQKIMQWPGWNYVVAQGSNMEEVGRICKNFPGLLDGVHNKYQHLVFQVYCFWNYRLGEYLHFKKYHRKSIRESFYQGDQAIEAALEVIKNPIQDINGNSYAVLASRCYFVAFITVPSGWNENSMRRLHPNFGINMFVMDKLLDAAYEIFKLEDENGV